MSNDKFNNNSEDRLINQIKGPITMIVVAILIIYGSMAVYDANWIDGEELQLIGGMSGVVMTAFVLFVTTRQTGSIQKRNEETTRKIQNENMKLNKTALEIQRQDKMESKRTYVTSSANYSDLLFELNKDRFIGSKILITKGYGKLRNIIEKKSDYTNLYGLTIRGASIFLNAEELDKKINCIKDNKICYNQFCNIGDHPIFNCSIEILGKWESDKKSKNVVVEKYEIDCIEGKETIFIPLIRLKEKLDYEQFDYTEIYVRYLTGLDSLSEITVQTFKYEDDKFEQMLEYFPITNENLKFTTNNMGYRFIK